MKHVELEPKLSHVVGHSEAVGQSSPPIDNVFVGISDQTLSELVFVVQNKIKNSFDSVFSHNGFLIQVNDPIIVAQNVVLILQTVLKSPSLAIDYSLIAMEKISLIFTLKRAPLFVL